MLLKGTLYALHELLLGHNVAQALCMHIGSQFSQSTFLHQRVIGMRHNYAAVGSTQVVLAAKGCHDRGNVVAGRELYDALGAINDNGERVGAAGAWCGGRAGIHCH